MIAELLNKYLIVFYISKFKLLKILYAVLAFRGPGQEQEKGKNGIGG